MVDSGARASNAFLTYLQVRDSSGKPLVKPDDPVVSYGTAGKSLLLEERETSYQLVGEVKAHQG